MSGTRNPVFIFLRYLVILLIVAVLLLPFLWIFVNSFRPTMDIVGGPEIIPSAVTLDNYSGLLNSTPYWTWVTNSTIVAILTIMLTVPISVAASYGLNRCHFPGRNHLGIAVLAVYAFPTALLVIPMFSLFSRFGLLDTYLGLAIVNTLLATPFSVWLLQAFMRSVPSEIEDASAMDGSGRVRTLVRIVVPQILPGIFSVAVFAMVVAWTEYLFASVLMQSDSNRVLAVGMADLIGQYRVDWGRLMAGAVMTAAPVILLFSVTARWFLRGVSAGALD